MTAGPYLLISTVDMGHVVPSVEQEETLPCQEVLCRH